VNTWAARGAATARAHPRHLVLAAAVAGLVAAPVPAAALAGAAAAGAIAAAPVGGVPGRSGIALLAVAALLGCALVAAERRAALDRSALGPHLGRDVGLRAVLLERPRRSGRGRAALVRVVDGPGRGERVVVRATRWPPLEVGGEIAASGPLLALRAGDGWLRRRGAHARLLAGRVRATGRRRGGLAGLFDRLRGRAERAVAAGLDPPRAALARGMVLGQDEALTERDRERFRDSGLAHLLAASGQNVALLAALAIPLLGALGLGLRGRLAGALAMVAVYVPLAGAGPSIQRAGVMGAAGMVAALASRRASRWYALLLAAAVTLLLDPRAAGDPGWQLSFAAVAAIATVAPGLGGALRARGAPPAIADATAMTLAATIGTAPLLALHFGRVSLVSPVANLLAVPAVAPAMWLGMLAAGVGLVAPPAAALVNALAQYPLAYVGWVAAAAAALPHASVAAGGPPVALLAAACILAGLAAAAGRAGARRWRMRAGVLAAAAVVALVALAGGGTPSPPDPRAVVVSFLDVGQGDATLVQHGGATVLVDTGPPRAPLLERLRSAGVRRVDLLVVTHAQADHEGNAAAVLERLPVAWLLDGAHGAPTHEHRAALAVAARRGVRRLVPDAGQALRVGPLQVRVLWPPREPPAAHAGEDPNRRAVVAHVRAGTFDLLLPADAESEVTGALDVPEVEALKVAHHGSADPGLPDLLRRLRPRVAVIEVGRGNRYGHPTAQVLAALRAVPAVRRTDRDGTVRLTVTPGGEMRLAGER
jgi:competence protein ComEC